MSRANVLLGIVPGLDPDWSLSGGAAINTTDANITTNALTVTATATNNCWIFDLTKNYAIQNICIEAQAIIGGGTNRNGYLYILVYDDGFATFQQITLPFNENGVFHIASGGYSIMQNVRYIYIGIVRLGDGTVSSLYLYELQGVEYASEPVVSDTTDSEENDSWQVKLFGRSVAPWQRSNLYIT